MYPALTLDYQGLTTALSFNYVISDRVNSAVSRYRDRGFVLHERCSQVKYHSPQHHYHGHDRSFVIPDGKLCFQAFLSPYCKQTEREINDWGTLSMAFTAQTNVVAYPPYVNQKLSMRFLGQETEPITGVGRDADHAWIETQNERRYWQYDVKDSNTHDDSPDVDLNMFPFPSSTYAATCSRYE
ncbi:hypothetical protein BKA70DRAFT_1239031 [Coprinopsis sp. MPI-PUGE-AT-0042]|nr:hypothetical protein BKA70DRAFT_1239031 [Coprinopsis sp. MPI-PUGE-AT-0042]